MNTPPTALDPARVYGMGPEMRFRADLLALEAHWLFLDLQSGIEYFEIAIFRKSSGGDVRVFPATEWLRTDTMAPSGNITVVTWETVADASRRTKHQAKFMNMRVLAAALSEALTTGSEFFFRVRAFNFAGMVTSADTNGIKIDDSPPSISRVKVGVMSDEPENLQRSAETGIADIAVVAERLGVKAFWSARDAESGISAYYVAVGTVPVQNPFLPYIASGNVNTFSSRADTFVIDCALCSVTGVSSLLPDAIQSGPLAGFLPMGIATSAYIDLAPQQLIVNSPNVRYAVTVVAVNGAGTSSTRSSRALLVAKEDVAGTVLDGPDPNNDLALQRDDTITATFYGWESQLCGGMMGYEWALGTIPGGTDVMGFTPEGIVMMGDHGLAQAPTPGFASNVSVFATVRGVTMCRIQQQSRFDAPKATQGPIAARAMEFKTTGRTFIESTSSGVVVDKTPPEFVQAPALTASPQYDSTMYRTAVSGVPIAVPGVEVNRTIHVRVTSENGATNNYYVTVDAASASSAARLSALTIVRPVRTAIPFDSNSLQYFVRVPYTTTEIVLSPTAALPSSVVFVGLRNMVLFPVVSSGLSDAVPLAIGNNTVDVKVLAEDKLTVLVYSVVVQRTAPSTSTTLSSITLLWNGNTERSVVTPSGPGVYVVSIAHRFDSVAVMANSSSVLNALSFVAAAGATTYIPGTPLVQGRVSGGIPFLPSTLNVSISVTAEDGTTTAVYVLTVRRAAAEAVSSLQALVAAVAPADPGLAPDVASTNTSYYLVTVDATATLVLINATALGLYAKISLPDVPAARSVSAAVAVPVSLALVFDVVAESGARSPVTIAFLRRAPSSDTDMTSFTLAGVTADRSAHTTLGTYGSGVLSSTSSFSISNVAFQQSFIAVRTRFRNPRAVLELWFRASSMAGLSLAGNYSGASDREVIVAVPPVFSALPTPRVLENTFVVRVIGEDGVAQRNWTWSLRYVLPDSLPRLSSLALSYAYPKGPLTVTPTPAFDPNATRYTVIVPASATSILLRAVADRFGSVRMGQAGRTLMAVSANTSLPFPVAASETELNVQVVAQDGAAQRLYTIVVLRDVPSNATDVATQATLDSGAVLVISGSGDNFTIAVPYATSLVRFAQQAGFPYASVSSGSLRALRVLTSTVSVVGRRVVAPFNVTSESGIVRTVTFVINVDAGNTNASLASLRLYTPTRDVSANYTSTSLGNGATLSLAVAYPVVSIFVTAVPVIGATTMTAAIGGASWSVLSGQPLQLQLDSGLSTMLLVTTTSQSGSSSITVRVNITRLSPSTSFSLQSLSLSGYTLSPAFSPGIASYRVSIAKAGTLALTAVLPAAGRYASLSVGLMELLDGSFSSDPSSLKLQWKMDDTVAGMQNTTVVVGTTPWGRDAVTQTYPPLFPTSFLLDQLSLPVNFTARLLGLPLGATVFGSNNLNASQLGATSLITIDTTRPAAQAAFVVCPRYTASLSALSCAWYAFADRESSIRHYLFGVGTFPGDVSLYASTFIGWTHHFTAAVSLQHGQEVYASVVAINSVGMEAAVSSNPIRVDTTPPVVGGRVWELADIFSVVSHPGMGVVDPVPLNASAFQFNTQYGLGSVVDFRGRLYRAVSVFDSGARDPSSDLRWALHQDAQCQRSRSRIKLQWDAFSDPESGIDHYEIALGTTAGGQQVSRGWIVVDANTTEIVIVEDAQGDALALMPGMFVYARVKAINGVNMSASVASNGVGIAVVDVLGSVFDGTDPTVDARFQRSTHTIAASWSTNDACPVELIEVSIVRYIFKMPFLWNVKCFICPTSPSPLFACTQLPEAMTL